MKKITIFGILILLLSASACGSDGKEINTFPNIDMELGVTSFDSANTTATFKVWAPLAKSVILVLKGTYSSANSRSYSMSKDLSTGGYKVDKQNWNGVWQCTATDIQDGELYQYKIDGTLVLDPYAKSMASYNDDGCGVGAVVDTSAINPSGGWAAFTKPTNYTDKNNAIIYEVHVRDFTITDASITTPTKRGMYTGFVDRLSHLQTLGTTHIQLLPIMAARNGKDDSRFTVETTEKTSGSNYNWGFDPQSYFAPEGMYSENASNPISRVSEIKTLVNEAHKKGMGIILDVVYNHTADESVLDNLAPGYFYRGSNKSGCGNDTASEKLMMRKLIIDSIKYWTEEYKIDGFRFDLMGILDNKTVEDAYSAAKAINPNILFLGEGWMDMYAGDDEDYAGNRVVGANQAYMASTDNFAVFSDSFRDTIKGGGMSEDSSTNTGFITGGAGLKTNLMRNIRGDATNFTSTIPGDCVNYLTAHDGLTLHDKIAKIKGYASGASSIFQLAKLAYIIQMTSQGITFIHAGCEMGRTKPVSSDLQDCTVGGIASQYYCYNTYDASDSLNAINWTSWMAAGSNNLNLYNYVAGLIDIRQSSTAFSLGVISSTAVVDLGVSTNDNILGYKVTNGTDTYIVMINATDSAVNLNAGVDLTSASILADASSAGTTAISSPVGVTKSGTTVTLSAQTGTIIKL